MNDDLISRAEAVEKVKECFDMGDCYCDKPAIIGMLNSLTPAQPETAKRIVGKSKDGMTLWYQCDMCNEPVDAQDNFCRGCGRRLTDG